MSIFSEYLTELMDSRGMAAAWIAQICGVNKTSVSRWCNGSSLPQSWERMKPMIGKMRLTPAESRKLKAAYEYELLGASHSESFHKILELCQTLKQRRAEYKYPMPGIYAAESILCPAIFDFMKLDNKADILQCIGNELEKSHGRVSYLCLKLRSLSEPLMLMIKQFGNHTEKKEQIDILLRTESSAAEKIGTINNMLGILFANEAVRFYVYGSAKQLGWDEQDYIISDDFCISFSEDMSYGMLSRNVEWITFLQLEFHKLKNQGKQIMVNHCEAPGYVQEMLCDVRKTEIQGRVNVIEYMPCLSIGLTEQILKDSLDLRIPGREAFICNFLERFPRNAASGNLKLASFFAKEGLIEFMETGRIDSFPYSIYRSITMRERCEILCNVLELSGRMPAIYFICMKEGFINIRGIHIEQWYDRVTVGVHFDDRVSEQVQITDASVEKEFEKFYEYLLISDYVYSKEETRSFMIGVLEKYCASV